MSFGPADLVNSGEPELLALAVLLDQLQECAGLIRERARDEEAQEE